MDKQKKLKIAFPALIIIMAFVWGPIILGGGKSKDKSKKSTGSISMSVTQQENEGGLTALSGSHKRQKAKTTYTQWGRNPFTVAQDLNDLVVEGIAWDENNPKAIINGQIITVGDKLGANTIVAIEPNSVIIKNEAEEVELRLGTVK